MSTRSRAMITTGLLTLGVIALEGGGCGRSSDVIASAVLAGAGGAGGGAQVLDFEPCAEIQEEGRLVAVNMLLTVDKSMSMATDDKWQAATAAFVAFFDDPDAARLRVALRLWPDDDGCDGDACDAAACAEPDVALGPLSDAQHREALADALEATEPFGFTPMSAALSGALAWATAQRQAAPDEAAVIVLVTDGAPRGCTEDIADIADIAADAAAIGVPVFAVGIEGSNEFQMDLIAAAGATDNGYFVGSADAEAQLLTALQDIEGKAVSCSFPFPEEEPDKPLTPDLMRLEHVSDGEALTVPRVNGDSGCTDEGGWYLDDPDEPTTITLCETTCETVQDDEGGRVDIAVGCECEVDVDCPGGDVCEDHRCIRPCASDEDCPADRICHAGHCVPRPGEACNDDLACPAPLVCVGGQCSLGGVLVADEEAVQGGAFACEAGRPAGRSSWPAALCLLGLALAAARGRRR